MERDRVSDEEITVVKATGFMPYSAELAGDFDPTGLTEMFNLAMSRMSDPNYVPPKPWEGPPLTPVPAGYQRMLDEFPASRTAAESALVELIELHGPKPSYIRPDGTCRWRCEGCDASGYEWEPPDWPCETSAVIARHLGVEVTE